MNDTLPSMALEAEEAGLFPGTGLTWAAGGQGARWGRRPLASPPSVSTRALSPCLFFSASNPLLPSLLDPIDCHPPQEAFPVAPGRVCWPPLLLHVSPTPLS